MVPARLPPLCALCSFLYWHTRLSPLVPSPLSFPPVLWTYAGIQPFFPFYPFLLPSSCPACPVGGWFTRLRRVAFPTFFTKSKIVLDFAKNIHYIIIVLYSNITFNALSTGLTKMKQTISQKSKNILKGNSQFALAADPLLHAKILYIWKIFLSSKAINNNELSPETFDFHKKNTNFQFWISIKLIKTRVACSMKCSKRRKIRKNENIFYKNPPEMRKFSNNRFLLYFIW